jgi:hypothetical protein
MLGLISLFSALNNLQTGIVHPDIVASRKDEIDLAHKTSVKSIMTTTFQIRALETVSGYKFVLMAENKANSKKLDNKLEEIYKTFVNYVIKLPFLSVNICLCRNNKEYKINNLKKGVMIYFIENDIIYIYIYL